MSPRGALSRAVRTPPRAPFPRDSLARIPPRVRSASDAFDLDALVPDTIEGDLEGLQEEAGAEFDDDGVPLNYGDVDAETTALTRASASSTAGPRGGSCASPARTPSPR